MEFDLKSFKNNKNLRRYMKTYVFVMNDVAPFGVWLFSHVRFDIILLTLALIIELEKHQETPKKRGPLRRHRETS